MRCPHCDTGIAETWQQKAVWNEYGAARNIQSMACPECHGQILKVIDSAEGKITTTIYPTIRPRPIPVEVTGEYRQDYEEAAAVLSISPKASAALSRRLLQHILRDKGGFTQKDLAKQIDDAIQSGRLPSHLADAIDGVRNIGNFAAHPLKSQSTGEIVDVEPGEAEWLLETLDGLLDFYVVQPVRLKAKRDALNKKLADLGKPPMKSQTA